MDGERKWVIWSRREGSWEAPNEKVKIEIAEILITEKGSDKSEKDKRLTKCVFKVLHAQHTQSHTTS